MSSVTLPSAPVLRFASSWWRKFQRSVKRAGPDEGELVEVLGRLRHEPLREEEVAVVERGRSKVGRRPRADLEVPRVDVRRRARQEDEDAVLRAVLQRDVRRGGGAVEQTRI